MSKVENVTIESLLEANKALLSRIEKLEESNSKRRGVASTREMTDEDAFRIMTGDMKDKNHKKCAEELGLSYGQIYSCRLEYTFKQVHKKLKEQKEYKNQWVK